MKDSRVWRERINRYDMNSLGDVQAKGLALIAGVITEVTDDLSNLMKAHLKAIEEATEGIRKELKETRINEMHRLRRGSM